MMTPERMKWEIKQGDWIDVLRTLPDESVNCCVTSPPYWGLRDYGVPGQLGLERTPDEYVAKLVAGFREVRRVLRNDGTLWLNLGDSYASGGNYRGIDSESSLSAKQRSNGGARGVSQLLGAAGKQFGCKPKDLVGIPWMVAFALRADGWYLRQDIIWCLSGGAWVYARTQKGDMPLMVRDVARLDPSTVKLWNGEKWTQVHGWSRSKRRGTEVELVLRSGERISCTPTHQWPTERGLLKSSELGIGDVLESVDLPEPDEPMDTATIDNDVAWLCGLYIAEGSRSNDTIQIAGHAKEQGRWDRCQRIAHEWGGCATRTICGNKMDIRLYGKLLNAVINQFISGKTAKDKCMAPVCWRYSNAWLHALLDGYLSGDGGWDAKNERWRLGFCRNYNLERDLRTLAARTSARIVLNPGFTTLKGKRFPMFRGELRFEWGGHHNCKNPNEIVEIRKSRCREVYDIGVADEPHTYALASGIVTHNSKPNPMPESVTDRCTKSHEYIFLMSKSARYYYDADAIKEDAVADHIAGNNNHKGTTAYLEQDGEFHRTKAGLVDYAQRERSKRDSFKRENSKRAEVFPGQSMGTHRPDRDESEWDIEKRNKRSVWTVNTKGFSEAHFATFPPKLIEPCILAGCPEGGNVIDTFSGAGTTGLVATRLGRNYIGIELNPEYIEMSNRRITQDAPLFNTEQP